MLKIHLSILSIAVVIIAAVVFYSWKIYLKIPQELPAVNILDYRGAQLSILKDFQGSSLKGSQRIDPAKYLLDVNGLVSKPVRFTYEQLRNLPGVKKCPLP